MVWVYRSLFNCSPIVGHFGCFQFLAVTNGVAVNYHIEVFRCT